MSGRCTATLKDLIAAIETMVKDRLAPCCVSPQVSDLSLSLYTLTSACILCSARDIASVHRLWICLSSFLSFFCLAGPSRLIALNGLMRWRS